MDFWNLAIRIILLLQTSSGIFGNSSLIIYYLIIYYRENKLKSIDLIIMNIMIANALIIVFSGIPETISVWGFKHFLNDFECKFVIYIHGIGRSVSIGSTCILSILHSLTLSPRKSCWKYHKVKFEKNISFHIFLLWIFYIFINFIYHSYLVFKMDSKNNRTEKWHFGYCSTLQTDEIGELLYSVFVVGPEIFLSILMAWSNGFMIVILYRHKKRVQHIRSTHDSSRNSPESRVNQNIVILLSTFLFCYTFSSIIRGSISHSHNHSWWMMNLNRFISMSFPSFGPLVFINHYSILSKHCFF